MIDIRNQYFKDSITYLVLLIDSIVIDMEEEEEEVGDQSYGTDMIKSPRKLVKESRIWSRGMEDT